MAEKRMFSMQIVDSDAFFELPLSSQALYFHLGMRADDDGILNNAKSIARSIGATNKDFEILVSKKFIINFDNGISVIKHWKVNNYIAKDRYRATTYLDVKKALKTKENGVYTMGDDTERIQIVDTSYTQSSKDKNSEVKVSIDNTSLDVYIDRFEKFWDVYPKKIGKGNVQKWFRSKKPSAELLNTMLKAIETQGMSEQWQNPQYIPMPMTWLNQERWGDELPIQEAVAKDLSSKKMTQSIDEITAQESAKLLEKHRSQQVVTVTDDELERMFGSLGNIAESKRIK